MEPTTMPESSKLRIAVLIKRFLSTGGAERYALEVTRRLALQHEVHVFAHEWSFQGDEPITFHRIPRWVTKPSWVNQLFFSYFSRKAVGEGFDIVHSHEKVSCFDAMTIHSPCFRSFISNEKKGWKRMVGWFSVAFSPRKLAWLRLEKKQFTSRPEKVFIAVSENVKKDVQANYFLQDDRFRIAYPGIDVRMRSACASGAGRKASRAKLGIPENDLVILFVGTEFKRKGLDALLRAISLLPASGLKLVVAGGGGGKAKVYKDMAKELGLKDGVLFLGLVENVGEVYGLADICVLPTLSDPYGMAPVEAMLCGVPVALSSSEYCGAAEHVKNGEALIIENPRDPKQIAEILDRLMDEGLRTELARKGRSLAEKLTWEETTSATLSAFTEVLRRKRFRDRD